jgi:hypothetical protein
MGHWREWLQTARLAFAPGRDRHFARFHRSKSTVPSIKSHIQCWRDGVKQKQCATDQFHRLVSVSRMHGALYPCPQHTTTACSSNTDTTLLFESFQAHTMATSAPWQAQTQLSSQPWPELPRVGMVAPGKPIQQALRSCPHSMDVASDFIFKTRNSNKMSTARRVTKSSEINSVPG